MNTASEYQLPTEQEFLAFQRLILEKLGIFLPPAKRALLANRWGKRLRACNLNSYGSYYRYVISPEGASELHLALELITTNETYFFREQKHFEYLTDEIIPQYSGGAQLRIWSAAASTGEEPYSIAMTLADRCKSNWELMCSDVNSKVLESARLGIYPESRTVHIPDKYLRRYCRKGIGSQDKFIRVANELREKVNFFQLNLHHDFPNIGKFDVVFLRNVLIYFENDIKQKVIDRISNVLNPGGILFVGHSESLHGLSKRLISVKPAIYKLAE